MEIRALTARSVVLSTLLGVHPPRLPVRHLVRVGALFGIADGAIRVALSRMVAAGDLARDGDRYRLTDRLLARQARQDEARSPRTRPWDGGWEIAVITAERRPVAERTALRQAMSNVRLAELREGVWMRPANLLRARPDIAVRQCTFIEGRPEGDPAALAASLWDLDAWAAPARDLQAAFAAADGDIVDRFTLAAAVVRHLMDDPLLPAALLPADWPGPDLRTRYERFRTDFARLLSDEVLT
ncbi:PaaX family transcriptional regulator C-terminal domain-containing protein [Actinomadura algeriensis]|uniref:Phenylacetic acid degradation operon negative regulatory protein n=1 Tax=Actinomadura algeriensis TaxID=1679523 RepID=A0ABR9JQP0_9ACTN|nr:PaaX family transcriptional regulator C-terminal domain-containing protein [Actinomadura algeriensis]MBE1532739.1 phenylacetic acid degradation operon negative regulatory protein [Actinomadura algeriensis]